MLDSNNLKIDYYNSEISALKFSQLFNFNGFKDYTWNKIFYAVHETSNVHKSY